ncbi:MAG: acyltransferase family protein, partial [Aeromicrobium sp.]
MVISEAKSTAPRTSLHRASPLPADTLRAAPDFRPDIQGLRALAVSLVLVFHLWPNRLGGGYVGVDIFFVISGFLITSHLVAHPPRNVRGLATFWGRRARRLLPASFLVLFATLVASRLVAPDTQWANTARDVRAATLYVLNWRLAGSSVDYLAAENAPSPAQHFWSLSVEEQFYLIWPVLILGLIWWALRSKRDQLTTVLVGLSVVAAASLTYSVYETSLVPASAYFVTPTRIWELGVGGILAVFLTLRARNRRGYFAGSAPAYVRVALTLIGLGAILYAAFAYSGTTPFPGWRAVIPILGCTLLIGIGPGAKPLLTDRILANRPAQWLGDISYSVYLWHWPIIVLLPAITGNLNTADKAAIVVASLVLASLTKTYVEDRFRTQRSESLKPTFVFAFLAMAVLVALTVLQTSEINRTQSAAQAQLKQALAGDQACFGANAMAPGATCSVRNSGPVVPAPAQAAEDMSDAYDNGCRELRPFKETVSCTYGDPKGDVSIALIGNSHAVHWLPALDRVAKKSGWRITTYLASGCTASFSRDLWPIKGAQQGCFEWGQRVLGKVESKQFDLVVLSDLNNATAKGAHDRESSMPIWEAGYRKYLSRISS